MKFKDFFLTMLIIFCFFLTPLNAYLDPGTGSMLLYFIIGIFASTFYYIKDLIAKIKNIFHLMRGDKSVAKKEFDVIFFSEGDKYYSTFEPLLKEVKFFYPNMNCAYYTSDKNDKAINFKAKNITTKCLGSEAVSIAIMNHIRAKVVIMTTPQIDVLALKRSKYVDKYIHIVHTPASALLYKKYAFDYFDIVMCSGSHQIKDIRELEKNRDTNKKVLLKTGLSYFDYMLESKKYIDESKAKKQKQNNVKKQKTILIAPTWGKIGMIANFGDKILELLTQSKYDYNIIFRPHPQIYIDNPKDIKAIEKKFSKYDNFKIDTKSSGDISMSETDILVSDVSGIIFDFAFVYKKPVIGVNFHINTEGLEANEVNYLPWEIDNFSKFGISVDKDNLDNIADIVNNTLNTYKFENLDMFLNDSVYNFGKCAKNAIKQLNTILLNIKNKQLDK
jgi:hypothetical protein